MGIGSALNILYLDIVGDHKTHGFCIRIF